LGWPWKASVSQEVFSFFVLVTTSIFEKLAPADLKLSKSKSPSVAEAARHDSRLRSTIKMKHVNNRRKRNRALLQECGIVAIMYRRSGCGVCKGDELQSTRMTRRVIA
jgi:hypothetical protein